MKMRLREEIGSPSTTDYSDTQCGNDVISAINQYSKYKPDEVFDSLTSVVNQSVYDLSEKDRIMNVTMVFYSINLEWEFDRYWPMSIDIGRLAGISLFENPSIWTQYVSRLKEYKAIFERSFEFNRTTKSLRLIPQPIHQRAVPYIYTRRHTAETIPEEDIDDMLLWAKWMAKQALAAKARRSKEITQVSGYGISATISLGAKDLMEEAKEHKDDFERRFGALSSIMMVG